MIRRIEKRDALALHSLIESAHDVAALDQFPIGAHWTLSQVESDCQGWLSQDAPEGSILAFVMLADGPDAREIRFLATAPQSRGQGRMQELLCHVLGQLGPIPPQKPIWLEVHEANEPARRLYRKLGFREVGKRPRYYRDGGAAILMSYG